MKNRLLRLSVVLLAMTVCMTSCIDNEEPSGLRALREGLGEKYKQEGQAAVISANAELALAQKQGEAEAVRAAAEAALNQAQAAVEQAKAAREQAQIELDKAQAESAIKIAEAASASAIALAAADAASQAAMNEAMTEAQVAQLQAQAAQAQADAALTQAQADAEQVKVLKATAKLEKTIEEYNTAIADEKVKQQKAADDLAEQVVKGQTALLVAQKALDDQNSIYEQNQKRIESDMKEFEAQLAATSEKNLNIIDLQAKKDKQQYIEDLSKEVKTAYDDYVTAQKEYIVYYQQYLTDLNDYAKYAINGSAGGDLVTEGTNTIIGAVDGAEGVNTNLFKDLQDLTALQNKLTAYNKALEVKLAVADELAGKIQSVDEYRKIVEDLSKQIADLDEESKNAMTAPISTTMKVKVASTFGWEDLSDQTANASLLADSLDANGNKVTGFYTHVIIDPETDKASFEVNSTPASLTNEVWQVAGQVFGVNFSYEEKEGVGADAVDVAVARNEAIAKYIKETMVPALAAKSAARVKAQADLLNAQFDEEAFKNDYYEKNNYGNLWKTLYTWFDAPNGDWAKIKLANAENQAAVKAAIDGNNRAKGVVALKDDGTFEMQNGLVANNYMLAHGLNLKDVFASPSSYGTIQKKDQLTSNGATDNNGDYRYYFSRDPEMVVNGYYFADYYFENEGLGNIQKYQLQLERPDGKYYALNYESAYNPVLMLVQAMRKDSANVSSTTTFSDGSGTYNYGDLVVFQSDIKAVQDFLGIKSGTPKKVTSKNNTAERYYYWVQVTKVDGKDQETIYTLDAAAAETNGVDADNIKEADLNAACDAICSSPDNAILTYDNMQTRFTVAGVEKTPANLKAQKTYYSTFYDADPYSRANIGFQTFVVTGDDETNFNNAAARVSDYKSALDAIYAAIKNATVEHERQRAELRKIIVGVAVAMAKDKQEYNETKLPDYFKANEKAVKDYNAEYAAQQKALNELAEVKAYNDLALVKTANDKVAGVLRAKRTAYSNIIAKLAPASSGIGAAINTGDVSGTAYDGYNANLGLWQFTPVNNNYGVTGDPNTAGANKLTYYETYEEYAAAVVADAAIGAEVGAETLKQNIAKVEAQIELQQQIVKLYEELTPNYEIMLSAAMSYKAQQLEEKELEVALKESLYKAAVETFNSAIFNGAAESIEDEVE